MKVPPILIPPASQAIRRFNKYQTLFRETAETLKSVGVGKMAKAVTEGAIRGAFAQHELNRIEREDEKLRQGRPES